MEIMATKVKCGGCVTIIQDGLGKIDGVSSVLVDVASGKVTLDAENVSRNEIVSQLAELGYPEA